MRGKTLGSLHFWQAAEQGRVLETLSLSSEDFPCDWQDWDQWAWKPQGLPFSQAAARLQTSVSIHHSPAFHMVMSRELGVVALLSLLLLWLGPVCCISLLCNFGFLKGFPKCRPSMSIPSWEPGPWNSVSLNTNSGGVLELNAKFMSKNLVVDLPLVPTQVFSQSELDLHVMVCSHWCRSWDWSQVSETPWWLNQTLSQSTSSVDILAGHLLGDTW